MVKSGADRPRHARRKIVIPFAAGELRPRPPCPPPAPDKSVFKLRLRFPTPNLSLVSYHVQLIIDFPLPMLLLLLPFLLLSAGVGYLGRNTKFGFWGNFVCSIVLTPIVGLVIVLAGAKRK